MRIEIRQGDISAQADLDAVVNAANTELWMGSGVAGALKRRGGEAVELEAVRQGPIALGDAVRTSAGALPNRHVIHAAAMGFRAEDEAVPKRAGSRSSAEIIRHATLRSLALADEAGDRSIGFPALATGVGGFPIDECAKVMIASAQRYASDHPSTTIDLVAFVVRSEEDRRVFEQALR
jgi:O-acetyl-ADP-ribose deacetylase